MQYDNPFWSSEITDALTGSSANLSTTTVDAISQILNLDTVESVVVGSWDGSGDVVVPTGKTAQAIFADVAGAAGTDVDVNLHADGLAAAKAFVFASDANLTLDFTAPEASAFVRAAVTTTTDNVDRVIVSGNGNDTITVGNGNTTIDAGAGNDTVHTGSGNDLIIANSGNNDISTGAGNDTIIAGTGNDTIDAGDGFDTVQVAASRADFTATVSGDDVVLTAAGQTITTANAEFISFNNGDSIAVAANDQEAAALRLYEGLLGRDADAAGAQHWTAEADAGTSLTDIANAFLSSGEFSNNANDAFVESLYTNLLGREADTAGEAKWLADLANGASRTDVINSIAGSAEGQAASASSANADYVEALYSSVLGRTADATGLQSWVAQLEAGADRATIADGIAGSAEASAKATSDFLDNLYESALGRDVDALGKAAWTSALEHGATQAEVAIAVVGSDEGVAHNTSVVVVHGVA
ncbi:DUF4214 domain-containing protein [Pseudomonas sp. App30]|uniref:DUF4214 domain-containing protein n=1 Tax=Pseudomonas sp. App30 TaxID=3068990 RepID=UPI003A7FFC7C